MAGDQELATFERELPNLLKDHRDQFALILGDRVDSVWNTEEQAVAA
jgi:hypothetical protein